MLYNEIMIAIIALGISALGGYLYESYRECEGKIDWGTKWAIIAKNFIVQVGILGIYIFLTHMLKPLFN